MLWSFILAAVGIAGLFIAGKNNRWGWAIGLGAQLLWLAYALTTQQWGFIATALAYGWVYGLNFWRARARTQPATSATQEDQ